MSILLFGFVLSVVSASHAVLPTEPLLMNSVVPYNMTQKAGVTRWNRDEHYIKRQFGGCPDPRYTPCSDAAGCCLPGDNCCGVNGVLYGCCPSGTRCGNDDFGNLACKYDASASTCSQGTQQCTQFSLCCPVGTDCALVGGNVQCAVTSTSTSPPPSSVTVSSPGSSPSSSPLPGARVAKLLACQPCGSIQCSFAGNGQTSNTTYDVVVGSLVNNCGGGNTTVKTVVGGARTIGSSWSIGSTIGVEVGVLKLEASFEFSQQKSIQLSQTFEINIEPGQMGAMVATISYSRLSGLFKMGGDEAFPLVLNSPGSTTTYKPQVIPCDQKFTANLPSAEKCPVPRVIRMALRIHGVRIWRRSFASVPQAGTREPQTFIEKVVQNYALGLPPGKAVRAGDYVMIKPEFCMSHDNTGPIISKFRSIGASKIHDPRQPVFTLDHDVQNKSAKNMEKYASIEAFARAHSVDFYPAGRGIGHQILVEEGYAFPHTMTVASDSHSNMLGGVGCVGTPIVRTDAAAIWATGQTWWQVPRMVKVEFKGQLSPGVTGKDVIVSLCGLFNRDEVLNAAIEFSGDGVASLSVDDRLTIANMTTEWGALAGVFPVDETLLNWYDALVAKLESRTFSLASASSSIPPPPDHPRLNRGRLQSIRTKPIASDPDAHYSSHIVFDLGSLVPHVSGPNSVKISTSLPELEKAKIAIQKAYLVSCTNSRVSDISAAAAVLKGKRVAPGVELYVAAASSVVQREAELRGDWDILIGAGAKVLPPGCGPCIGLGTGLLEEGQTGISATNRNYKGRMGHPKAQAYLASPAVVAASAIKGYICAPDARPSLTSAMAPKAEITSPPLVSSAGQSVAEPLIAGFPTRFSGSLVFAPQDNLNTDGIYPGKYTYQDDITLERQAEVVMENYDPSFASSIATLTTRYPAQVEEGVNFGTILVAGYNFGTGSSREQAATALKAARIPLVIAGSFGDIFKRNAINNGLVCLECPDLVRDLTDTFAKDGKRGAGSVDGELTVNPGWQISVGMADGKVEVVKSDGSSVSYAVRTVGKSVQELWLCGGLVGFVLKTIRGHVE